MQIGPYILKETFVSSGMFSRIQSMSPRVIPACGKSTILKTFSQPGGGGVFGSFETPVVDSAVMTMPSISLGEMPASSIALRIATIVRAPMLVSGFSSQRRAVGEVPTPVAQTLPRPSQRPSPSRLRCQELGAIGIGGIVRCPYQVSDELAATVEGLD